MHCNAEANDNRFDPHAAALNQPDITVLLLGQLGQQAAPEIHRFIATRKPRTARVFSGGTTTEGARRATAQFLRHLADTRGCAIIVAPTSGDCLNFDIHKLGGTAATHAWRLCGDLYVLDAGNASELQGLTHLLQTAPRTNLMVA